MRWLDKMPIPEVFEEVVILAREGGLSLANMALYQPLATFTLKDDERMSREPAGQPGLIVDLPSHSG